MPQHGPRQAVDVLGELPREAGLADTGHPRDEHEAARTALRGGVEQLFYEAQLAVTADKGRLDHPGSLRAGDRGDDAGRLVEPHGLGLSLERVLTGVRVGDGGRSGRPGRLLDVAAPRGSGRLDPGGGVDPVTDDEALLGRLGRRRAAGDDPDPGLELGPLLGAVAGDGRDELEAGADRPFGIVLLGDRGTPDGHDGVTDELLHDAAVAGDDRPGELEIAREDLTDLLGVALFREGRESHEVAEQHRDVTQLGRRAPPRAPGRAEPVRPRPCRDSRPS